MIERRVAEGDDPTVLRHRPPTRRNRPWKGYYQDYRLSLHLNTSQGSGEAECEKTILKATVPLRYRRCLAATQVEPPGFSTKDLNSACDIGTCRNNAFCERRTGCWLYLPGCFSPSSTFTAFNLGGTSILVGFAVRPLIIKAYYSQLLLPSRFLSPSGDESNRWTIKT